MNSGGGLVSTPDDLARFYAFHAAEGTVGDKRLVTEQTLEKLYAAGGKVGRERIVDKQTLEECYRPWLGSSEYYGLGFQLSRIDERGVAHRIGGHGSSGTYGWVDRDDDLIAVFITQAGGKRMRSVFDLATAWIEAAFLPEAGQADCPGVPLSFLHRGY